MMIQSGKDGECTQNFSVGSTLTPTNFDNAPQFQKTVKIPETMHLNIFVRLIL